MCHVFYKFPDEFFSMAACRQGLSLFCPQPCWYKQAVSLCCGVTICNASVSGSKLEAYYRGHLEMSLPVFHENVSGSQRGVLWPWKRKKTGFYYSQRIPECGLVLYLGVVLEMPANIHWSRWVDRSTFPSLPFIVPLPEYHSHFKKYIWTFRRPGSQFWR